MYDLTAGQVVFVNEAYRQVLHGHPDEVNAALPALLHPDDRPRLADYWMRWCQGAVHDEVEFRLRHLDALALNQRPGCPLEAPG